MTNATALKSENREASRGPRVPLTVKLGYVILGLIALVVAAAPWLAPYSPTEQNLENILQAPSLAHWLGTDDLGRDVLSRMTYGTRTSVLSALYAVLLAALVGIPLGIASGWLGGFLDTIIMRVVDAMLSFPAIVLALGITAVLGPGLFNSMTAVGIVLAPEFCRLARAKVMTVKGATYIEAAASFGARGIRRMILPHVVPNAIQPLLVQASLLFGFALIAEASLSFLHLGVQPPDSSWGSVLASAYTFMTRAPWQILFPGIAIAASVFSLNVIGDDIQRRLDPRRK